MRVINTFVFGLLLLQSAFAQQSIVHWQPFIVSSTLDTAHLPHLTNEEKQMQTQQKADVETFKKGNGKSVELTKDEKEVMNDYKTSVTLLYDSVEGGTGQGPVDYATLCSMDLYNDTLLISAGVGFMANEGVGIKIYKNRFTVSFSLNEDDMMILKKNLSDTAYTDGLEVASVYRELTFLSQPKFEKGEKLCGYLEAKFEPYYEHFSGSNKAVKQICHAKIFFTGKIL